jgi:hypothetical protein
MTRAGPPAGRLLLLPLAAFAIALALHAGLGAAGISAGNPLRVAVTPAVGAAIVYFGLPGYPWRGRLRLGAMVATGLLLLAFAL